MKLPDALRGIRQIAFDTAPLIYFVERHPVYFDRMLLIMRYVDRGLIAGVASTVALAEVLVQPLRAENTTLAERYETVLAESYSFRLETLTTTAARRAGDLRARYNLRTPDALHVATAIEAGCDAFLTNDAGIKRVSEINVLVLDELELDEP
ncbi:MAG: type II toxin-antitoxin system VapC family toxin [Roseiflexaceae bacterium]|nr:type II toxin-antitoxin system VapC family toxin [Roseiflexaceae bacterium]